MNEIAKHVWYIRTVVQYRHGFSGVVICGEMGHVTPQLSHNCIKIKGEFHQPQLTITEDFLHFKCITMISN